MATHQINDKYNCAIVKNLTTQEEVNVTPDLAVTAGTLHYTISPGGPTSETHGTNGGTYIHKSGAKTQTVTLNIPTRSRSARILTRWMKEITSVTMGDTELSLTVTHAEPTEDNTIITRSFEGIFKEIPEEQHGGGIHHQNWEFIGREVS